MPVPMPFRPLAATLAFSFSLHLANGAIDYHRDIAPIYRSYCAGCHNDKEREGEFSLETYAGLRTGGDKGDPITPSAPSDSYLIKVIEGHAKPKMPPKDEPQLPSSEIATLKSWIAEGAHGPSEDRSLFSHLVIPQLPPSKHRGPITALAYSPDGSQRATGYFARVAISTGTSQRFLEGLPGKVNALQFSPDNTHLLVATGITGLNGVAQLWNIQSGELVAEFGQHSDVLFDAAFSPDGSLIATAGYDHVIHLWDTHSATRLHSLTAHQGAVFDLAFHPSGELLASASADETVKLWRVSDGLRLDTLSQPQGELASVCFTPDGNHILAAGADKRLHLWKLVSRREPALNPVVHSRFAHDAAITALLCLPQSNHLISAASDTSVKVWSLPDLTEIHAYAPLADVVATLAAMPQPLSFEASLMDGTTKMLTVEAKPQDTMASLPPSATDHTPPSPSASALASHKETEPNNNANEAESVSLPVTVHGNIHQPSDTDHFRFSGKAGQSILLAVNAARSKSLLDSKIEVLDHAGNPIEQVKLQATRDSWFTFRGKDSNTSDDFRLHNWDEMELNEYLYANGEVSRLWLYPRGPDSGFKVYPGSGKRHTYFFTPALSHPLGQPSYIVTPLAPDAPVVPNGLPVYSVYWENDDDSSQRWGADSLLWFDVPADGDYLAKISDVRGFGGAIDYHYQLTLRDRQPDFEISMDGKSPSVSPGSGREITFTIERHEGFDGPVEISIDHLPVGFTSSAPIIIEAEQRQAIGVIYADITATDPHEAADGQVRVTATGHVAKRVLTKDLGTLGDIQLGPAPKLTIQIQAKDTSTIADPQLVLPIHPGETISARVLATRHDFEGRIELGNEDSGRNLPHGLYVDNIGLNGLLIVEGQSERDFFITAAPWVASGKRLFHLRATADGGQASPSVVIEVLPR